MEDNDNNNNTNNNNNNNNNNNSWLYNAQDGEHTPLLEVQPISFHEASLEERPLHPPAAGPSYIWLWVLVNIVSYIMQYLSLPLWIGAIPQQCSDPFVIYQVSASMFMLIFLVCVMVLSLTNGNRFMAFVAQLSRRGMWLIVGCGLMNALNGICVAISSPVARTPPIISTTVPNIGYSIMIVVIWYMHHKEYLPKPKIKAASFFSLEFSLFFLMYAICVYSTIVATNEKAAELGGQIYWWVIFLFGMFFGYLYNQIQEIFFKTETFDGSINTLVNFLFVTNFAQFLCALLGTWVDFIPGVTLAASGDIACGYVETASHSFTGMGLLWNFVFTLANLLAYVASAKTNTVNTGLTMLIGPISTALIIAISYNIPALTPDKSLVDVYFFFPMILSATLMTFFYACWYKGTRLDGRLIYLQDYFVRYDRKHAE